MVLFLWAMLAALAPAVAGGTDAVEAGAGETVELRHQASFALIAPDVGLFTVTRTYGAKGLGQPTRLDHDLALPDQSVVTSFAVRTDGAWRKGRLERPPDPEQPGARGDGGSRRAHAEDPRRPWASLDGGDYRSAHVATAPLRAPGQIQIRYTVWAQAEPRPGGRRWIYCGGSQYDNAGALPEIDLPPRHPELRLGSEPEGCVTVEKSEPDGSAPAARFGVYRLNTGAWWWRLELAVPARIADVPGPGPSAPIVFVLDASRSQREGLGPQLEIVRSYLANTPDARVEVILANRTAERLFGRFLPAREVGPAIPATLAKRPLGNGSFLDRGAALAAELLRDGGAPGWIVLFTDGVLRARFDRVGTQAALQHAPKGTVVHLAYPGAWKTDPQVTHRVPEELDALAAALGGGAYDVLARAKGGGSYEAPAPEALRTFLRPDGLESLLLHGGTARQSPEWPVSPDSISETRVGAGQTQVWSGVSRTAPPRQLAFSGWVWGRELRIPARRDAAFERRLPRLVTSVDQVMDCEDSRPHVKDALVGRFLAPGLMFRVPGSGEERAAGSGGIGGRCNGMVWGNSRAPATPAAEDIVARLGPALDRCGLTADPNGPSRAQVETHGAELLDVAIRGVDEATRACFEEAVWGLSLPAKFNAARTARVDYDVRVAPRAASKP